MSETTVTAPLSAAPSAVPATPVFPIPVPPTATPPATPEPPAQTAPTDTLQTVDSEANIFAAMMDGMSKNTGDHELRTSRMVICQPQAKEVIKKLPGFEQGMIMDNLTKECLSTFGLPPWMLKAGVEESKLSKVHYVEVLFTYKLPSEYIKWIPVKDRKEGDEMWEFKTLDINDKRVQEGIWKSSGGKFTGDKPPVTDNCNFLVLAMMEGQRIPNGMHRVATFSRTSSPCGKMVTSNLNALKMQRKFPWAKSFYLWTKMEENTEGIFFTFQLAQGRPFAEASEQYVWDIQMEMGKALSAKGSGELFQNMMINSAHLEDAVGGSTIPDDGNTLDGSTPDPFSAPKDEPSF